MRTAGMAGNGQNVGGEDSSASDARARTVPEYGGDRGPDQCARHGMDPAQGARDRVAAPAVDREHRELVDRERPEHDQRLLQRRLGPDALVDRKSTRLNSSHVSISYAVFCLKKKKKNT